MARVLKEELDPPNTILEAARAPLLFTMRELLMPPLSPMVSVPVLLQRELLPVTTTVLKLPPLPISPLLSMSTPPLEIVSKLLLEEL
jgi:hypothetical protein